MAAELLTKDDLELIDRLGVPTFDREDLWLRTSDDAVVFTVKGIAFLRETARVHSVALDLKELASYKALRMFCWHVTQAVLRAEQAATKAALRTHALPAVDRALYEAFADGDVAGFLAADETREACVAAGSNVVPLPLPRKRAQQ